MSPTIRCNTFLVAGTKYRKLSPRQFSELHEGSIIQFEREPGNEYDGNAIACYAYISQLPTHIGYIPKEVARHISPMLDCGMRFHAEIQRTQQEKQLVWAELVMTTCEPKEDEEDE